MDKAAGQTLVKNIAILVCPATYTSTALPHTDNCYKGGETENALASVNATTHCATCSVCACLHLLTGNNCNVNNIVRVCVSAAKMLLCRLF